MWTLHVSPMIQFTEMIDVVYLDFKKAFDTVAHSELYTNYGLSGLLAVYGGGSIFDQSTSVCSCISSPLSVISGVPQSQGSTTSVLGLH